MADTPTEQALRRDYEAALALHGFRVEPARDAVMFESFKAFRALLAELDRALPEAAEPGPVWSPAAEAL